MTTHEHAFSFWPSEPRHPYSATTLARPRDDPVRTHGKRRNEKGMEQAAPRHATTPVNAGSDPDAPQRRPMGRVSP